MHVKRPSIPKKSAQSAADIRRRLVDKPRISPAPAARSTGRCVSRLSPQRKQASVTIGIKDMPLQRKIGVKHLAGDTYTEKDAIYMMAPDLHDALLLRKSLFLGFEGREISERVWAELEDYRRFRQTLSEMGESPTDYGVLDLSEDQHVALFYYHVRRKMVAEERLTGIDNEAKLKESEESDEQLGERAEAAISGKAGLPDDPSSFPVAILGAGASAAYYLATAGRGLDPGSTVIIGETQPWETERGSEGVINHPLNMIAPEYQGRDLLGSEGGLAPRRDFSEIVEGVLAPWPHVHKARITSVRRHVSGNYYTIVTADGTYYARRVIAAMGIGKHKAPGKITWAGGDKEDVRNKVGRDNLVPRMMDMDRFQRAIVGRELENQGIRSVAVIGPNAAIDVMSTVLRNYPELPLNPIYWVTGVGREGKPKRPFFLKGTDNEYIEGRYDAVVQDENETAASIYKKGVITVVGHDYLSSDVSGDGVAITYGQRADRRIVGDHERPAGVLNADIVVYGMGPNVRGVAETLGVDMSQDIEPIFDVSQHFNYAEGIESRADLESYIESVDPTVDAEHLAGQVAVILGVIAKIERPEKRGRKVDQPPSKLPPVVGMRTKGEGNASMEFIGATGYRFAMEGKTSYDYVSRSLKQMRRELPAPQDALPRNVSSEFYKHAHEFWSRTGIYLGKAIELAELIEAAKDVGSVRKKEFWIKDARDWIKLMDNRVFLARYANDVNQYSALFKKMKSAYAMASNFQGMLEELYQNAAASSYGARASTMMGSVSGSLPGNVVLGDQLTASRSSIEALQTFVPPTAAKGVNFVTSDHTVIATHIAAKYSSIPPQLADYVTAKIVLDRRHSDLEDAPLPRPDLPGNRYSGFNLEQQNAFQARWNTKLEQLSALF